MKKARKQVDRGRVLQLLEVIKESNSSLQVAGTGAQGLESVLWFVQQNADAIGGGEHVPNDCFDHLAGGLNEVAALLHGVITSKTNAIERAVWDLGHGLRTIPSQTLRLAEIEIDRAKERAAELRKKAGIRD